MEEIADKYIFGLEYTTVTKTEEQNTDQYNLADAVVDVGFIYKEYHTELMYHVKL
jgi:hypothetical protein